MAREWLDWTGSLLPPHRHVRDPRFDELPAAPLEPEGAVEALEVGLGVDQEPAVAGGSGVFEQAGHERAADAAAAAGGEDGEPFELGDVHAFVPNHPPACRARGVAVDRRQEVAALGVVGVELFLGRAILLHHEHPAADVERLPPGLPLLCLDDLETGRAHSSAGSKVRAAELMQ